MTTAYRMAGTRTYHLPEPRWQYTGKALCGAWIGAPGFTGQWETIREDATLHNCGKCEKKRAKETT